jgi:tetratricopeptide (TPR) repeat protein
MEQRLGKGPLPMRILALLLALSVSSFAATPVARARDLYNRTEYRSALKLLAPLQDKDAAAYLLMGQCYYMQGDPKNASNMFQKAVDLAPGSSEARLWLGRAYGRRAETSSFITAPSYASKARQNFEKAVELDPANLEAISDLFEYYLDAPGFLGGGLDKAAALAQRIQSLNPAEFYWAQARLAEKQKEFQTAEQQLRRASDLAPRQIGRVIDLAKFLAKVGRYQESEEAFQRAAKIDPDSPQLLFERARTYIRTGRNLETARALLRKYLAAHLTPDDPPRKEAERLLKSVSSS